MLDPILWSKLKKTVQLDDSGTIPSEYWPSDINEVQEVDNLPAKEDAKTDTIYIVTTQNLAYRWDEIESQYFLIGAGTSYIDYQPGYGISIKKENNQNFISLTEEIRNQLEEIQETLAVLTNSETSGQSPAKVLENLVTDTQKSTKAVTWGVFS